MSVIHGQQLVQNNPRKAGTKYSLTNEGALIAPGQTVRLNSEMSEGFPILGNGGTCPLGK